MYAYLEIVKFGEPEEVVKRMDVTGYHEKQIDRIDSGVNVNLNNESYYTRTTTSETPLNTNL